MKPVLATEDADDVGQRITMHISILWLEGPVSTRDNRKKRGLKVHWDAAKNGGQEVHKKTAMMMGHKDGLDFIRLGHLRVVVHEELRKGFCYFGFVF